jgi:hypothetical protein
MDMYFMHGIRGWARAQNQSDREREVIGMLSCWVSRLHIVWLLDWVAANILNKQSRTADKGWYSNLGIGRGADNYSP